MLSMKTLRVAIVTMGSALLLGSGLAVATVQQLDGRGADAAVPVMYAQELLTILPGQALKSVAIDNDHDAHKLVVSPSRLIEMNSSTYLRLSLGGGMVFSELASDVQWSVGVRPGGMATCTYDTDTTDEVAGAEVETYEVGSGYSPDGVDLVTIHSSGGSPGDDYLVVRLDLTTALDLDGAGSLAPSSSIPLNLPMLDADPADPPAVNIDDNPANDVPDNNSSETCDIPASKVMLWVDVKGKLAIPAGKGAYSAMISLHSDPDQAQAGTNASSAVHGMATVVTAVDSLDVAVKAADQPAVAHVGTAPLPFLWFHDSGPAGVTNKAVLGYAKAQIGTTGLLTPQGTIASSSDLLPDDSLSFTVEGDLSIGAFNLMAVADPDDACLEAGAATAEEPIKGNLVADEDGPADQATLSGQDAGTYHLCVQVDVQGPNSTPIPAGHYNATITSGATPALAKDIGSGVIGVIRRNGTTVKLTYLTVAEKYNQRLIIVNDGANEARYDIGPFVTETGVTATPLAMATGMVPAGGQVVVKVQDIVSFSSADGRRHRAAATLSMNADVDDVQVATTQVNLEDGSTDTVVYATVDGAVVQ